ncbi:hypothetical protein KAH81_06485 [bacterium]|nr:hypothetical protein [bacterium]
MRKRNVILAVVMLAALCGGTFAQFAEPMPFFGEKVRNMPLQISDKIDASSAMSFDEVLSGAGDIYVLYALWSPDRGKLLDSKIIPVLDSGDGLSLLGDVQITYSSNAPVERWTGFPEYGIEEIEPVSRRAVIGGDFSTGFKTIGAAPNINLRLEDGDIASLNLVYIEGTEVRLVEHMNIVLNQVFDAETYSLETGELADNWYRPDFSTLVLTSHFDISADGELILSKKPAIWGRSTEGLYISTPDSMESVRRWVAYSRNERFSLACEEMFLDDNSWNVVIYSSPSNAKSASLDNIGGVDFDVDKTVWFGEALFGGGTPISSDNGYTYKIETNSGPADLGCINFPRSKLRAFTSNRRIGFEAKAILGLDPNSDDSDGDGISDYLELLMFSDPNDPSTEDKDGFNDYELYFEMGMYPPMSRRELPEELRSPPPMQRSWDSGPSSPIWPMVRKRGAPIEFKYHNLMSQNRLTEAVELQRSFENMYLFNTYGERALVDFHRANVRFRFTEDWDTLLYGTLDSDHDGIPDGLEQSGRLFGGENYPNYGIHYWEEDMRLRMAFILGTEIDGLDIRSFINDTLWDDYGIVFISTEYQYDTFMHIDGFDTDKDGLDDYFEYLWCSCPLLKHSDPTSGALNDHEMVYQQFIPPRLDWVASFQDWDGDSIPNGAEIYCMAELDIGPFDPYCASSDWDQYSDRTEWMAWWCKSGEYPYPLDDPLPYVVRNGPHPLIPAFPVLHMTHNRDQLLLPFSDKINSSRAVGGESEIGAEFTAEVYEETSFGSYVFHEGGEAGTKFEQKASASWKVTTGWEMATEEEFDYGETILYSYFTLKNYGTEPFDYDVESSTPYCYLYLDLFWPGNNSLKFVENDYVVGIDNLVPWLFMEGDTGAGSGLPDKFEYITDNRFADWIGLSIESSTDTIPDIDNFRGMFTGYSIAAIGGGVALVASMLWVPIGFIAIYGLNIAETIAGLSLQQQWYRHDIYRRFIDDFADEKKVTWRIERRPTYNIGDLGIFSCDNPCDWTSIEAAHRSYVSVLCAYPGETDLVNCVKESPIKSLSGSDTTYYTLKEFIVRYSGGSGPPKIEPFWWDTIGALHDNLMDTLLRVGCMPNVGYNDTFAAPGCDSLTSYGHWLLMSSIDTIADPSRKADLPYILSDGHRQRFLGGSTVLKKGDIFVLHYLMDSDSDTLEDNMELVFGTNPYNPDSDFDGLYDGMELKLGLDPLNPNSDNSPFEALDGDEMNYFMNTDTTRLPVETFAGDTIDTTRTDWDVYLNHSPRTDDDGSYNFVPWPVVSGVYSSKDDDKYMDANVNGLADWVEHYFRDPNEYWNGRFTITWDGAETRTNPFGYNDNVKEASEAVRDSTFDHLCDTTTLADGNRVLEFICDDLTGEGAGMWDNSYIYFKLFNCNIEVNKYLELSYDLWPRTANGKHICVDLIFTNETRSMADSNFVDVDSIRMHPSTRPSDISTDGFTRTTASLAPFDGKTITGILVGYEDAPNDEHGQVHAYIDNLSIRNKNIVFTFEPESEPEEGFNRNVLLGDSPGFFAWNNAPGTPLCSLAMLSSEDPHDTTDIPIDTMLYGPRGLVYEVNGYFDPLHMQMDEVSNPGFVFSLLPEDLEYHIEDCTNLGYYIWHEHSPLLYYERQDLTDLVPPKVVIDFKIYNPNSGETKYMLDFLAEEGEEIHDQWSNSYYPWDRNEIDSEGDLTYRPVSGDFWRYIDVELPDILTGWLIQDILIRYESDLPCMGNLRSYIDNVSIFQRKKEVYVDTFGVYTHFGDNLTDDADNNVDTLVDWEEINIHKISESHINDDYVKMTYASLLLSNDIGPWSFDVDTITGDTTWHWFETDAATGETLWSWFTEFAQDSIDSTFKLAKEYLAFDDSIFTFIDVDSFPTTDFNDDDSLRNFGYMSNVPGDSMDIYNPSILCQRVLDGDEGWLRIETPSFEFMFSPEDSTLLFDVRQVNPCSLCTKRCLFMVYEAKVLSGSLFLGYKLRDVDGIVWFDSITSPTPHEYRDAVPDSFDIADSSRIVESVWIKATTGTEACIDNFMLRRAFFASFEPNDPPTYTPDRLKLTENTTPDTCDIHAPDDSWPTPTDGDYYLMAHGDMNGFSPSRFKYDLWELPPFEELELTQASKLSFEIYYHFDFPMDYGTAILDLRLVSFDDVDTTWLSDYFLPDKNGQIYFPQLRTDPLDRWVSVEVPLDILPDMQKVDRIVLYYDCPSVLRSGQYWIFVDKILITL